MIARTPTLELDDTIRYNDKYVIHWDFGDVGAYNKQLAYFDAILYI